MNPPLDLLLSRWYDGDLAPEHRADLEKSGLTEKTIQGHYIRSVPPAMISRLLGFDPPGVRSAMLLPFRSQAGGFMDHVRVRVFPPLTDAAGHTTKYLQPKGTPPRLYFPVPVLRVLMDDCPLWVIEGEKKALAVSQAGYPAVGVSGIEGWHRARSLDLLPDFDAIRLEGRIVELLPDGDVQTNPLVRQAVERLALALRRRGARPRLVLLPSGVKVDDYLRDPSAA